MFEKDNQELMLNISEGHFHALFDICMRRSSDRTWTKGNVDVVVRRIFLLGYDRVTAQQKGIDDIADPRIDSELELFQSDAQPNPEILAERERELAAAQEFVYNRFVPLGTFRKRIPAGAVLPAWFAGTCKAILSGALFEKPANE